MSNVKIQIGGLWMRFMDKWKKVCQSQPETVEHIMSVCQTLASDQYLNKHNQVAAQLYLAICKHYNIKAEAGTNTSLSR